MHVCVCGCVNQNLMMNPCNISAPRAQPLNDKGSAQHLKRLAVLSAYQRCGSPPPIPLQFSSVQRIIKVFIYMYVWHVIFLCRCRCLSLLQCITAFRIFAHTSTAAGSTSLRCVIVLWLQQEEDSVLL